MLSQPFENQLFTNRKNQRILYLILYLMLLKINHLTHRHDANALYLNGFYVVFALWRLVRCHLKSIDNQPFTICGK